MKGTFLISYVTMLIFSTWRFIYNENREKSSMDIKNIYVNGFLLASILVDMLLAYVFHVMSSKCLQDFQSHQTDYINFQKFVTAFSDRKMSGEEFYKFNNIKEMLKAIFYINSGDSSLDYNSSENLHLIKVSILKLESFYYTKYTNFVISSVYMLMIATFTLIFIILEIF